MSKKQIFLSIIICITLMMTASIMLSSYFQNKTLAEIKSEIEQYEKEAKENAEKYPQTYKDAIAQNKPVFLFFYAKWCTHCVRFFPIYDKLEKIYKGKYNFVKIDVDKSENEFLIQDFFISEIPAVFVIIPNSIESGNGKIFVDNHILHDTDYLKKELNEILKECKQ